ncbi:hypothetical protein HAZT_HAZT007790 [Hyalella azteca]|uniref:Prokaryotic-type class I peptide chain release factors domain-containing protein n=1 Tax=Hyalella azteca TaxID=294128 RepID=A0A6A0HDW8_HYAAZ|nr:hypothetical protein HAZT_HAZT007790 [Hyalella azteca]
MAITRNTVEVLHVITPFYAQNRNFSNKPPKIDRSRVPELREEDLEEKFICGWGPGGQSINKTASAVYLRNIPSGLFVKCQTYRAQHQNRKEARLLLQEKLDMLMNGEDSVVAQKRRLLEAKSSRRENKSKKRRQLQAAWKQSLLDEEPKSLSTEAGLTVNNDSQ